MREPIIEIAVFIFACLYPVVGQAQEVEILSVDRKYESLDSTILVGGISEPKHFSIIAAPYSFQDIEMPPQGNGFVNKLQSLTFQNPYSAEPGVMILPLGRSGAFVASGNVSEMPGLMRIESGSVGLTRRMGKFSMYVGGEANKYGYFNGLHTQYGVTGLMEYQVNPRLSFTVFGSYYFGRPPLLGNGMTVSPTMIGYYGVSSFGGTVNYQFNETFGLSLGAKYEQQFGTNRYRFTPIATPTVKIGKVKIGFPVGEILYDYVKSEIERKRFRAKPPVMPAKKGFPEAPTRS